MVLVVAVLAAVWWLCEWMVMWRAGRGYGSRLDGVMRWGLGADIDFLDFTGRAVVMIRA